MAVAPATAQGLAFFFEVWNDGVEVLAARIFFR